MYKMIIPQLMKTSMKKILTTLLMFFCITTVFSQYSYIHDVYSAKDMNIKGNVKKMIERTFYTDASGKVLNNEMKTGWKYKFDENGNLINKFAINLDYECLHKEHIYEYVNGKLSSYTYDEDHQGNPYKFILYYSPSSIAIKSLKGKILEVHSLSNNKVIEVTEYYEEKPSRKQKYDYNTSGQITKKTYKCLGMFCKGPDHFDMYEYNKQGDLSKKEQHGTLEWITTYNYNYDNNKNWTKCTSEFYKPGEDKDHRIYQQITREWEFYNDSGSSEDYDFDFGDLFNTSIANVLEENVTIGQQVWAKENLNTERFRNGDLIPEAKSNEEWKKAGEERKPAWCYYNNDPYKEKGAKFGKLYNWYAVHDPRGLAPAGYHIPSDAEFKKLDNYLGAQAGKKMKSTSGWLGLNNNNSSGFTGLAGGNRYPDGIFDDISSLGIWWSSTVYDTLFAKCRLLSKNNEVSGSWDYKKSMGLSVRCIKD